MVGKRCWNWLRLHPGLSVGGLLFLLACTAALAAPLAAADPLGMNPRQRLEAPSREHWMGTDEFGRDVFSRAVHGARASLRIGAAVVVLASAAGTGFGLLAGYYARLDAVMMRFVDGLLAFPEIILAITLAAVWGAGEMVLVLAMTTAYTPRMVRIVRSAVLAVKNRSYVESARAAGAGSARIMLRHILPNCLSPIIVQAAFMFSAAVLAEAALSFLGVGIRPPTPSWGGMISEGRGYMPVAPWLLVFPGGALALVVLGLNLLGDGLRDYFDPYTRT